MTSERSDLERGLIAHLRNLGGLPLGSAARIFLSFSMARVTSARVGSLVAVFGSTLAWADSASTAAEGRPERWFRAASKCFCQRCRDSSCELHGHSSALLTAVITGVAFLSSLYTKIFYKPLKNPKPKNLKSTKLLPKTEVFPAMDWPH